MRGTDSEKKDIPRGVMHWSTTALKSVGFFF